MPYSDTLHLAFSATLTYDEYVGVALYSILTNMKQQRSVHAYILHDATESSEHFTCKRLESSFPHLHIHFLPIDNHSFKDLFVGEHISSQTYYRGLLPELLPTVDKVLYLDCDLLVLKDILPLWEADLTDVAVAGVKDSWMYHFYPSYLDTFDPGSENYINAGVLLMNLSFLRSIQFTKTFLELAHAHHEEFEFSDQDIINRALKQHIKLIEKTYNDYHEVQNDNVICHYVGPGKPWKQLSQHPIYQQYLQAYQHAIHRPLVTLVIPRFSSYFDQDATARRIADQLHAHVECIYIDLAGGDNFLKNENSAREKSISVESLHFEEYIQSLLPYVKGDYLLVVDENADFPSHYLSSLVTLAEQEHADIALSHFHTLNETDGNFYFFDPISQENQIPVSALTNPSLHWRAATYLTSPSQKLMKTAFLRELPAVVFPLSSTDACYFSANTIAYLPENLLLYRQRKQPLVSVIVPVYNVQEYLPACLDSILHQTYHHLEILLINDGSTDDSGSICTEYAQKDTRITVIHKENGGLSDARNVGLEHATGDYVTMVDSDDWIELNFIEDAVSHAIRKNADIVIGNHIEYKDEEGVFHFYQHLYPEAISLVSADEAIQKHIWSGMHTSAIYCAAWGKLIKRSIFEHLRYPLNQVYEDGFVAHKLYLLARTILFVNQNYYIYRQRSQSIMNQKKSLMHFQSSMANAEEMILDAVLTNKDVSKMKQAYQLCLDNLMTELEERELTDSQLYKRVLEKQAFLSSNPS